jgi:hypothetical protein
MIFNALKICLINHLFSQSLITYDKHSEKIHWKSKVRKIFMYLKYQKKERGYKTFIFFLLFGGGKGVTKWGE